MNLSTAWPNGRDLPFDELKALSVAEGLDLPAGRQGFTLSHATVSRLERQGFARSNG